MSIELLSLSHQITYKSITEKLQMCFQKSQLNTRTMLDFLTLLPKSL